MVPFPVDSHGTYCSFTRVLPVTRACRPGTCPTPHLWAFFRSSKAPKRPVTPLKRLGTSPATRLDERPGTPQAAAGNSRTAPRPSLGARPWRAGSGCWWRRGFAVSLDKTAPNDLALLRMGPSGQRLNAHWRVQKRRHRSGAFREREVRRSLSKAFLSCPKRRWRLWGSKSCVSAHRSPMTWMCSQGAPPLSV